MSADWQTQNKHSLEGTIVLCAGIAHADGKIVVKLSDPVQYSPTWQQDKEVASCKLKHQTDVDSRCDVVSAAHLLFQNLTSFARCT